MKRNPKDTLFFAVVAIVVTILLIIAFLVVFYKLAES